MRETLLAGLSEQGLALQEAQIDQLCRYGQMLLEKNKVMNLTAITEPQRVATLHFLDSLSVLRAADLAGCSLIDVGCGAGFPGLPLKIAAPSIRLTLLDSLQKRIAWLRDEVLPALGVQADCVAARAEEFAAAHREQYDYATSRAVARLNILCELCLPLVRPGGAFLALKGADAMQEAEQAQKAIARLGGALESVQTVSVAGTQHCILVIRKRAATPAGYPRSFAKIKKQPL